MSVSPAAAPDDTEPTRFPEPFDYVPDGPGAAARAIGYIRGILETLESIQ